MKNDLLLIVNLRGGADALNMVVPYREADYYRARPELAIPEPGKAGKTVLDLDGFFGLHPSLEPLLPFYQKGELALVHAVGWPGNSHSHFEAWEEIESGSLSENRPTTGWLARYLQAGSATPKTPLRGVAFAETLPRLLTGALGVSAMRDLRDFRLKTEHQAQMRAALRTLYHERASAVGMLGIQTLDALETVDHVLFEHQSKVNSYPKTRFGDQLHAVEQLIRANVGLEAASVELIGWDTHFLQGSTTGAMANLQAELATGLATFAQRLEDHMDRILIVTISEFGRRVSENGSAGTDHGQGGLMMFLGKNVRGGRVYGEWPGLAPSHLAGPGDVRITTDFRDVFGEVVAAHLGDTANQTVFPGYTPHKRLGFLQM